MSKRLWAGLAVVCALALSGCGSSGGHLTAPTSNPTGATTPGGTSPTGIAPTGTAPTGGSTGSAPSVTGGSTNGKLCTQLQAASSQLTGLSTAISNPSSAKTKFEAAIKAFEAIGSGAPSNVQQATEDMITALKTAEKAFSGSKPDLTKLQAVTSRLGTDGQVIGTYIASKCTG